VVVEIDTKINFFYPVIYTVLKFIKYGRRSRTFDYRCVSDPIAAPDLGHQLEGE
jgi:hypothetical protein